MTIGEAIELALQRQQAGKPAEAEAIYRRILSQYPDHPDSLCQLGLLAKQAGRREEAVEWIAKAIAALPTRAIFHGHLGSLLLEMGQTQKAIQAYRNAFALEPQTAEYAHNLGHALLTSGAAPEAAECFQRAISIQPALAEAFFSLGNALKSMCKWEEAIYAYQNAVARRPDWVDACNNLANTFCQLGRIDEGIAIYQTALKLRPDSPEARNNLGSAFLAKGELDLAVTHYRSALAANPDYAAAHWNIGIVHLMRGEYEKGLPLYEWRYKMLAPESAGPMWDGKNISGMRLLIRNPRGLGDAIHFARYLPLILRLGATIIMVCPRELRRLFEFQWPEIEFIDGNDQPPAFDVQIPLLSLPLVMGTTLATIPADVPYLRADPVLAAKWKARMPHDERRKVGIVWTGKRFPDPLRAAKPADFAPLGKLQGLWLCSLQIGEKADPACGLELTDWTHELVDVAETAALVDQLDLIITVDTAMAHLAGAMGKPTWLLLKHVPDWRWMLNRQDSPWYPNTRLFRQEKLGDWMGPVNSLVNMLRHN